MTSSTQYDPNYIPQRGDVVQINFNPQKGIKIKKRRPALVLSPFAFNYTQEVSVVCPITHTDRISEFQVKVPDKSAVNGFIRADQFTTLNWKARRAVYRSHLPDETVDTVSDIVEAIVWGDEHDPDYIPVRGEVVEIEGESERCPRAVVLSTSSFNYGQKVFTICPIINPNNGSVSSKFAVEIPNEVNVKGVILADQVKSWDWWAREAKHLCYLSDDTVNQVSDIVAAIVWGD
jgi:mRNA interferase MazF